MNTETVRWAPNDARTASSLARPGWVAAVHDACARNEWALREAPCGCFGCGAVWDAGMVTSWAIETARSRAGVGRGDATTTPPGEAVAAAMARAGARADARTGLCPRCGVDSLVPEAAVRAVLGTDSAPAEALAWAQWRAALDVVRARYLPPA